MAYQMVSGEATKRVNALIEKIRQMENGDSILISDELARAVTEASSEVQAKLVDIMVKCNIATMTTTDFKTAFVRNVKLKYEKELGNTAWSINL